MGLVFLPFVLLFGLISAAVAIPLAVVLIPLVFVLWLPFLLVKMAFRLVFAVILIPIVLIAALIGLAVGGVALVLGLFLPLLPLVIVVAGVWFFWRLLFSRERFRLPA
jgi:hypothetical protein